jgi:alcohol dehydrogenase
MPNMIALTMLHAGGKFERVERAIPAPGVGELLIEVHACGVCHSDSVTVEGHVPGIQYPRVPGEISSWCMASVVSAISVSSLRDDLAFTRSR